MRVFLLYVLVLPAIIECALFGTDGFGTAVGGWRVGSRAAADHLVTLHVFLKHSPEAEVQLATALWYSATPTSPVYGRHLSFAAVNSLLRPVPGSVEAVHRWLGGVEKHVAMNPAEDIWQARCFVVAGSARGFQSLLPHARRRSNTRTTHTRHTRHKR